MIVTEKQKTLGEQSVYGDLAIRDKDCFTPNYEIVKGCAIEDNHFCIETNFEESRILTESDQIILRPLDLTKEISHKGYNDDKLFIPLVELANKARFLSTEIKFTSIENNVAIARYEDNIYHFWYSDKGFMCEEIDNKTRYKSSLRVDHVKAYGLFHQWHFDSRNLIESNEAISTDIINPYEVK